MTDHDHDQAVTCAACGVSPGSGNRRLTVSRRFGAGVVPLWAVVCRNCDRRESDRAFRDRMAAVAAGIGGARGVGPDLVGPLESATLREAAGVA